ncbi:MAG: chlorophyll a/b-binding protein [Leptolyngbyaceae cyanobacterium bins.349]|nr:chlorophyll a/b-binding protein [Leptolyngbyaceae cyanobacterium bins.349]
MNNPNDQISAVPTVSKEYNGIDRNGWFMGWTPQSELWNGRLAMIGFLAYLFWDMAGYSVVRDLFNLVR